MSVDVITIAGPTAEPVTTTEAKNHLRVSFDSDDQQIASMVSAARIAIEARSGMRLYTQTIEVRTDDWSELSDPDRSDVLRLRSAPLQSITSVKYYDSASDVDTTLAASDYVTDLLGVPARIQIKNTWPATNDYVGNIRIRCVAGYATTKAIPAHLKQAVLLLVGHFYENREAVTDLKLMEIPEGINALIHSLPEYYHYDTGSL
jgi:uncharacterized phiE125 gp8 family phage protein